jgi:hypothetical protein
MHGIANQEISPIKIHIFDMIKIMRTRFDDMETQLVEFEELLQERHRLFINTLESHDGNNHKNDERSTSRYRAEKTVDHVPVQNSSLEPNGSLSKTALEKQIGKVIDENTFLRSEVRRLRREAEKYSRMAEDFWQRGSTFGATSAPTPAPLPVSKQAPHRDGTRAETSGMEGLRRKLPL